MKDYLQIVIFMWLKVTVLIVSSNNGISENVLVKSRIPSVYKPFATKTGCFRVSDDRLMIVYM
jgi:hypothetical protein